MIETIHLPSQLPLPLRWSPVDQLADFLHPNPAHAALIEEFVTRKSPRALLLIGPGGSGKSQLLRAIGKANPEIVLVDQIQLAMRDRELEEALFHQFNQTLDASQQWCGAIAENPQHLRFALPDLQSRLLQCTQLVLPLINAPEHRQHLLKQQAAQLGFSLPEGLLDYLENHVSRDFSQQLELLKELHSVSLAKSQKLSLSRARFLLQKLTERS